MVTEYAPSLFKLLRSNIVSNRQLLTSFSPANNFKAIHNIDLGKGRSPSFFLFTDDQRFMLKTLKQSELNILVDSKSGFIEDYVRYLQENV